MKLPPLFSFHILRLYPAKSGVTSAFSQQLTAVRGHHIMHPYPEKPKYVSIDLSRLTNDPHKNPNYKKTDEYKELVATTRQEMNKQYAEKIKQNAYYLNSSYSANGKLFSYAQKMANKTKGCVIELKVKKAAKTKRKTQPNKYFFSHKEKLKPYSVIWVILSSASNILVDQKGGEFIKLHRPF